jgi:protein-tyrosine phosphatase
MEQRKDYRWNWCRFLTSWMRPERWVLILAMVSLWKDHFKELYGDANASTIWIAHAIVIMVCIFADTIKQKMKDVDRIKLGPMEMEDTK